jgi:hypothetical protein
MLTKQESAMHGRDQETMEYSAGSNDVAADVPEPMRLVMEENSRALNSITNKAPDSSLPKSSANLGS